jgi:serine beta-lactamase-like protein LACTB, mitochondrial
LEINAAVVLDRKLVWSNGYGLSDVENYLPAKSGTLVKKETLEQMWTSLQTRDGKDTGYGLGWAVEMRKGMKEVHHGGAQQRVSTFLYTIPEKGLAVVLMANLESVGNGLQGLCREIADILLQ